MLRSCDETGGTDERSGPPATASPEPALRPATAGPTAKTPRRGLVLLVEDEELVRALARRLLTRDGYEVIEAGSGADALAVAAAHEGRIDLLVCDVVMPGMSGPELAERLLAERPGTPVLFMSGYNDTAVAGYTRAPGEIDLLQKPFTTAAFLERVTAALGPATRDRTP